MTVTAQTAQIKLSAGGSDFTAILEENATAQAFVDLMPVTLNMSELNGNEKYYYLSTSLPAAPVNPGTIHAGDIMLYGSSCIVIFYKTFTTSYSYTRIGRIDNVENLQSALGTGSVSVAFSIANPSPGEVIWGDVNGDGSIDISDATALINYLLNGDSSGLQMDAADMNHDSIVDISDATTLINYLLGR